jgi:peptidoglycan/xylan/chitin deacetylase (PgdA/CDA1 family)
MQSRRLKLVLRYLRALFLYRTGLLWLLQRHFVKPGIVVLMFHRVLDDAEFYNSSSQPELLVRSSTFQDFLRWLSRRAEMVDLSEGLPRWEAKSSKLRVVITFDDGWLDNYRYAIPTAAGVPFTIFVCPGLMDKAFPFWPERVSYLLRQAADKEAIANLVSNETKHSRAEALENVIEAFKTMTPQDRTERIRLLEQRSGLPEFPAAAEPSNRTMSWQDLQKIRELGATIGSHTMTHPILTCLPINAVTTELLEARQQIEAELDTPCGVLAYPNGNHNAEIRTVAAAAGYKAAFTTEPGLWTAATECFRIPRINVFEQKIIGLSGRFSPAMAGYYLFWRAFQASFKIRQTKT